MHINRTIFILSAVAICLSAGCRSPEEIEAPEQIARIPEWISKPAPELKTCAPIDLRMKPPVHLNRLMQTYELPAWFVYGVMRTMGSIEMIIDGKYRASTITREDKSTDLVIDNARYDVSVTGIDGKLNSIASKCALAENELKRNELLSLYILRRHGSFVLFSLEPRKSATPPSTIEVAIEQFSSKDMPTADDPGWVENDTHYINSITREIVNNDIFRSLQKAEDDAIYDLAKRLVLNASKDAVKSAAAENVREEEVKIKVRGLHATRRTVNLELQTSTVTISVPKDGVTIL